jgi:hypothetical protein
MIKDVIFQTVHKITTEDASLASSGVSGKRTLIVDAEMSASGKVINGRIYPPSGHRGGLKSWLHPKPKPIIRYHNSQEDAIGRIISVEWRDNDKRALEYLQNDVRALADIKRAFQTNDAVQINKVLGKHGGFEKDWPGLGQVIGKLKIVDQDAIDKFLDERYMHFSAGQSTDAFICMTCGAKWHEGDHCDHPFGGKDEEGNPVYYLCGNMSGRELSVVNDPANDTSFVLGMQLQDDKNTALAITVNDSVDTQSSVTIISEKEMDLNDLAQLEVGALVGYLIEDETRLTSFVDSIMGETQYEISWLIRVHDSLHSTFDYMLKYGEESGIPTGVYKLHGALHDTANKKKFRDTLVNGELDSYGPDGSESEKYMHKQDSLTADAIKLLISETVSSELKTALDTIKEKTNEKTEVPEVKVEDEVKTEVQVQTVLDEDPCVSDDSIDWDVLDLALEALVGDAKLSTEKREALPAKSFCGPNKSFPVPDCAHVTAARRLIGRAKLSEDQKKAVLACVDRKAKTMGCDGKDSAECNCTEKDAELAELTKDYTNALAQIEGLTNKVIDAVYKVADSLNKTDEISGLKLDDLILWLDNLNLGVNELKPVSELKPIASPAGTVADAHAKPREVKRDKLRRFEELVIDTYSSKLQTDGKGVADRYLKEQLRYLPADFKIDNYITVNKE